MVEVTGELMAVRWAVVMRGIRMPCVVELTSRAACGEVVPIPIWAMPVAAKQDAAITSRKRFMNMGLLKVLMVYITLPIAVFG